MSTLADVKTALTAEEAVQNTVIQSLGSLASNAASEQADIDGLITQITADQAALTAAEAAANPPAAPTTTTTTGA